MFSFQELFYDFVKVDASFNGEKKSILQYNVRFPYNVFLMANPNIDFDDNYKKSDWYDLYLYKKNNGKIFYYFHSNKKKQYLEAYGQVLELPEDAKFISSKDNLILYKNEKSIESIVKIIEQNREAHSVGISNRVFNIRKQLSDEINHIKMAMILEKYSSEIRLNDFHGDTLEERLNTYRELLLFLIFIKINQREKNINNEIIINKMAILKTLVFNLSNYQNEDSIQVVHDKIMKAVDEQCKLGFPSNDIHNQLIKLYHGVEWKMFLSEIKNDKDKINFHKIHKALNLKLLNACENGDITQVKRLIHWGGDIHYKDVFGSPLSKAAYHGHVDIVKYLLSQHDNFQPIELNEALKKALYSYEKNQKLKLSQHFEVVDELIKAGANVNSAVNSPLLIAARQWNLNAIKKLIQAGANINFLEKHGLNFIWNIMRMHPGENKKSITKLNDILKIFLMSGANIHLDDSNKKSPLMYASEYYFSHEIVNLFILLGENENNLYVNGETKLMYAVIWDELDEVNKLLAEGVSIDEVDNQGRTALHYAVQTENLTLVKYLIEKGANINHQNKYHDSPLFLAIDKPEIRLFLLTSGADPYLIGNRDANILSHALYHNKIDFIKYLIENNYVNKILNTKFESPLYWKDKTLFIILLDEMFKDKIRERYDDKNKYRELMIVLLKNNVYIDKNDRETLSAIFHEDKALMSDLTPIL